VPLLRRHPVIACCVEAAFTGGVVALGGGATSPMLPYLLAPGLALGLAGTWRHVVGASCASAAGLTGGRIAFELGARVQDSGLELSSPPPGSG
jgi:hypothetical protein